MNKVFLLAIAVASASCAFGLAGNGDVEAVEREARGFSSIEVSGSAVVRVRKAPSTRVVVTTDSNLQSAFGVSVRGSALRLGWKPGTMIGKVTRIEVDVYLPELEGVSLSGSCELEAMDGFSGDSLSISQSGDCSVAATRLSYRRVEVGLSGSGDTSLSGVMDAIIIKSSGSGAARLGGEGDSASFAISGSGVVDAEGFACDEVRITVSGSCKASVYARRTLDVTASGSGTVLYGGDPRVSARTSGTATVRPVD
ncbi:MAG TPA: head GIN domain-containing protein [Spirochaetales bacterium]|nr:head GIN domain-containing protein [Spirochaetales bacterium]